MPLLFDVHVDQESSSPFQLRNAYLVAADGNAIRGQIEFESEPHQIYCEKRESGTAALTLQYPVDGIGELTLQTCLLPERETPYLLGLELARHRMMLLWSKFEDWGMFDLDSGHPAAKRFIKAKDSFVEALCIRKSDPKRCHELSMQSLAAGIDASEELALAHSELLLNKRKSSHALPRYPVGCGVPAKQKLETVRGGIAEHFDHLALPIPWKAVAPSETDYVWDVIDDWVSWANQRRMPIIAGPLINFDPQSVPEWLYMWEHDYDTARDLVYEHIETTISRYSQQIRAWTVVSGLHVNEHFPCTFDQIMDLTRMAAMLVKKLVPQATVIVELRQPYGEYAGHNARSIPPQTYADLIAESSLNFDAFSLRVPLGQAMPGQYTRDLMQVSNLLDRYATFNKPIYLTLGVPSQPVTPIMIADPSNDQPVDANSGYWRHEWSPTVQAHWLEAMMQIALSKPFIESVTWQDLTDYPEMDLPLGGLMTEQLEPKPSLRRMVEFRRNLLAARDAAIHADQTRIDLDDDEQSDPTLADTNPLA